MGPRPSAPERDNYRQVLLLGRLRSAIAALNPTVPAAAREDAIRQVLDLGTPVLLAANRHFHRLLVGGVPVQYQQDGETRGDFVRLVDWADPARNEWLAVNQFSVTGPHHTRRPDIVLFVNGLPLVLIELKNPADLNADVWKAFHQIQTYKAQIPDIFQYNEVLVISDGSEALLGSLSADSERFMAWRTIDGNTLDPLGKFNELQTLVRGALAPAYLLDYLRYFVLFEDDGQLVKKIAGYHQFHAVRAAIAQVVTASRPNSDARLRGKGGVVWHTQGSGKSITMTCFAARVMQEPAMENPTIVVITDRNDLDGQLFGVFSLAQDLLREQPVQANTRQDLRALLGNRPSGGIVFATIQKFMPGEDEDTFPLLSDRHNIVVIADEAHRTQYGFEAKLKTPKLAPRASSALTTGDGETPAHRAEFAPTAKYQVGYAQHLRDALPNATFVAFTGTPVSGEDRDTRAVFGDYISVYDMQQAKEDGATVAIYYESRLAKLGLKADEMATIDDEVDELAEDEEESQQAKLKSRWAALEKVVGAAPRIAQVAADLVAHFEERNKAQTGKAMVVAMSREICVHLYDEIVKLRPDWHSEDPEQGRDQDRDDGLGQRQGAAAAPHLQRPGEEAAGEALQGPGRPAAPGDRARHVAHRLRRALRAHAVRRQADEGPQPDAGHRPGEPRVQGQAGRPGGGLHRHRQRAEVGAEGIHRQQGPRPADGGRARGLQRAGREAGRAARHAGRHERPWLRLQRLPHRRPQDAGRRGQLRAGPEGRQEALRRPGAGDEQGLHAVLHARRGQGGARGSGLLPGREGDPDQARDHRSRRRPTRSANWRSGRSSARPWSRKRWSTSSTPWAWTSPTSASWTTPSWPRCATCPSATWPSNCWSGCSKARSSHASPATWCRARSSRTCWPTWCSATRTGPSKPPR
jgi:HsdR family type I site-specific deoxyribonuclease